MSTRTSSDQQIRRCTDGHCTRVDAVLAALRRHQTATVSLLAQETGYSRPTVTATLDELCANSLAEEASLSDQGVGRPATSWRIRPDAGIIIGVDLLATSMLLVVVNLRGEVLLAHQYTLDTDNADRRLSQLSSFIHEAAQAQQDSGRLLAVGVSATGVVDPDGSIVASDFVPVWSGFPLAERLTQALGVQVIVENDINMAAFGEYTLRYQEHRVEADSCLFLVQFTRGPARGSSSTARSTADVVGKLERSPSSSIYAPATSQMRSGYRVRPWPSPRSRQSSIQTSSCSPPPTPICETPSSKSSSA